MVCPRCIKVVNEELVSLGLVVKHVELGKAEFEEKKGVSESQIEETLRKEGFELIKTNEEETVEQIKHLIIDLVRDQSAIGGTINYSQYISEKLSKQYTFLSKLFSNQNKITIEKYLILQRIEYAKELIQYGKLSFSEIAYKLGYKSPQHFSTQFKSVTGRLMKEYKSDKGVKGRRAIDKI
jgi:AraC family transcriptional regulator